MAGGSVTVQLKYSTTFIRVVLWLVGAVAPNAESQHKASVGTQVAYQTVDGHDDRNESANFSWIFLRISNIGRANTNTNTANFSWIFSNIGIWKANTNTANFSWIFLDIQYLESKYKYKYSKF